MRAHGGDLSDDPRDFNLTMTGEWSGLILRILFRVHITLNGFQTTQNAHVDTTFSEYVEQGGYWFPTTFEERVRGPIRIHSHDWRITGRDTARGWTREEVHGPDFSGAAAPPAGTGPASQN